MTTKIVANSPTIIKLFLLKNTLVSNDYSKFVSTYLGHTTSHVRASIIINSRFKTTLWLFALHSMNYNLLKTSVTNCIFCKPIASKIVTSSPKTNLPTTLVDNNSCSVKTQISLDLVVGLKWAPNSAIEMLLVYFPTSFASVVVAKPQALTLVVYSTSIKLITKFLKNHWMIRTSILIDLWATDFPSRLERFEVNYLLMTPKASFRLNLRVFTDEWRGLPSVTDIFSSADWLEREVWDMFGVYFYGHKDMRRILTDYGFFGHPLRKDFPVTGYFEVRYDNNVQRVVLESLNLVQELRFFNFDAPWKRNLPNFS